MSKLVRKFETSFPASKRACAVTSLFPASHFPGWRQGYASDTTMTRCYVCECRGSIPIIQMWGSKRSRGSTNGDVQIGSHSTLSFSQVYTTANGSKSSENWGLTPAGLQMDHQIFFFFNHALHRVYQGVIRDIIFQFQSLKKNQFQEYKTLMAKVSKQYKIYSS